MTVLEKGHEFFTAKTPRLPREKVFDWAGERPNQNPSPYGQSLFPPGVFAQ